MLPQKGSVVLLLLTLLASCGDDPAPKPTLPSWAKVAPEQIAEAEKYGVPVAFENDLGMRFVLIPAGTFLMGSPEDSKWHRFHGDLVEHEVTLAKPFYISITEVTNAQFRMFRPGHVSCDHKDYDLDGPDQPVVGVLWHDAVAFCTWANGRLPTEEEWERAARAGRRGDPYPWGSVDRVLLRNAHGDEDGFAQSSPVGWYPPNRYCLYDVVGNVWEWCADEAHESKCDDMIEIRFGDSGPPDDPLGNRRVIRGGSWMFATNTARCASRSACPEDTKHGNVGVGFRLVADLPEPGARGR